MADDPFDAPRRIRLVFLFAIFVIQKASSATAFQRLSPKLPAIISAFEKQQPLIAFAINRFIMSNSSLADQDHEALGPSLQNNNEINALEPREDQPLLQPPDEDSWKPPRGFVCIQLAIMSDVFLYGLDSTITAAIYAVISSEFDAANTASWLTTSYLVTSTAFQPLYGRVSDIFGRRLCFFISNITFAFGCLGCGVANNIIFLNVMRALTGFGGGGLMTMGNCNSNFSNSLPLISESHYRQFGHDFL
jgi:hypothetical protein